MNFKTGYLQIRSSVRHVLSPPTSSLPIYANPEVTYQNTLEHHTPLRLASSVEEALQIVNKPCSENSSKWVRFLASADHPSTCKFRLFKSPKEIEKLEIEDQLVKTYDVADSDPNVRFPSMLRNYFDASL